MADGLTGWETTRLSKHFILLDFLADREVYRSKTALAFGEIWNEEHEALAKGLCNDLLEPLMMDTRFGPVSIADAFVPSVIKTKHKMKGHRWTSSEATADIAFYKLVDKATRGQDLGKAVLNIEGIDKCCYHVNSYPETEFVCITYRPEGAKNSRKRVSNKTQNLRAHHVRVGRYFNLLDFCRNGQAVEEGINLVPKNADSHDCRYRPVPEETAARSFAAALDPLVESVGRVSVVRGMETAKFAHDGNAKLHRWDSHSPWRLVFVLPQGEDPKRACDILMSCPHVREVQPSHHASESFSLALVVDQKDYDKHHGLRPDYIS